MSAPLHSRVANELRDQILGGELPPGSSLPSESRLGARFDASRGTIRSALAALRNEGLIGGGQGRPPVVRESAASQSFETLLSFSAWAEQSGRTPGQRTLEIARRGADVAAASALGIQENTPVVEVLRLRTLDGEPAMLERACFVLDVGRLLFDFDADSGSLWAYLTGEGIDLHSAKHTFDAVAADETDADLLELAVGSPLLRERRTALTADGRPLEYSEDRYRPDRVTFTIDNTQPTSVGATRNLRILKESS